MSEKSHPEVKIGDKVLVHGFVGEVTELMGDMGFMYRDQDGELIAYNYKWTIDPTPKQIWICE
jgi:hypothetical protein